MAGSVGWAQNSVPLPPETVLVAASGAPAPGTENFSIAAVAAGSSQPDLIATLTDLQIPAALASAEFVVTQGDAVVGTAKVPTDAHTATISMPAAVGQFTVQVIATADSTQPNPAGSYSVCVAPKATPTACIVSASFTGSVAAQTTTATPTTSAIAVTLTVTTPGSYTFTYADDGFPAPLSTLTLALFQGGTAVAVPLPASPAPITLSAGTYTLLGFAQADPVAQAGLYGITVSGPATLLDTSYAVGSLAAASTATNPSAQALTLTVTDFAFPAALGKAQAAVTSGGTLLGSASAGTATPIPNAPAGALQVWTFATAGTASGTPTSGTLEVDLTSASATLLQSDAGVNTGVGAGQSLAYAITTPTALQAGSYILTVNDFQFPAPLTASPQVEVVQSGAVLATQAGSAAGSVNFTAAAGPAVILVAAEPGTTGNGLVDVNIQTGGSTPQGVFDQLQPVSLSGTFTPLRITLGAPGNYAVSLNDLMFPAEFGTLALIGSSNGSVLGTIYGGGSFTVSANTASAASASLQFFVVAIPDTANQQEYGLYGLQILDAPPTVTLTASPTSVVTGKSTTLSWTTTNATACVASGGNFTGSQTPGSGTASVTVSATTTYTLTCTGPGGSGSGSAAVTATAASAPPASGHSGGGGLGLDGLGVLGALAALRLRRSMSLAVAAG
jgi:hypothetical protein